MESILYNGLYRKNLRRQKVLKDGFSIVQSVNYWELTEESVFWEAAKQENPGMQGRSWLFWAKPDKGGCN